MLVDKICNLEFFSYRATKFNLIHYDIVIIINCEGYCTGRCDLVNAIDSHCIIICENVNLSSLIQKLGIFICQISYLMIVLYLRRVSSIVCTVYCESILKFLLIKFLFDKLHMAIGTYVINYFTV